MIRQLPPENAVNVLLACWDYLETETLPQDLSALESIAVSAFFPDLEDAWARYEQRVNARTASKNVDCALFQCGDPGGKAHDAILLHCFQAGDGAEGL